MMTVLILVVVISLLMTPSSVLSRPPVLSYMSAPSIHIPQSSLSVQVVHLSVGVLRLRIRRIGLRLLRQRLVIRLCLILPGDLSLRLGLRLMLILNLRNMLIRSSRSGDRLRAHSPTELVERPCILRVERRWIRERR
jgi:hypothetical protein